MSSYLSKIKGCSTGAVFFHMQFVITGEQTKGYLIEVILLLLEQTPIYRKKLHPHSTARSGER